MGGLGSGGHNRKGPNQRPAGASASRATALQRWPAPPAGWTPEETAAWNELGAELLPLRTVAASDLIVLRRVARIMARVDSMLAGPAADVNASLINAWMSLLKPFGATPATRRAVQALPSGEPEESGAASSSDLDP